VGDVDVPEDGEELEEYNAQVERHQGEVHGLHKGQSQFIIYLTLVFCCN